MNARVLTASAVLALCACHAALGWQNELQDPGFEAYQLDPKGFYVLPQNSPWKEITMGKASVVFDAGKWTAPADMLRERPLGFSPGTTGFDGMGPEQNKGRIIIEQDVTRPDLFTGSGQYYEA